MKNLQTFDEFVNESLNENYTVQAFIKDAKRDGADYIADIAQKIAEYLEENPKNLFWISSEDDDKKFKKIEDRWNRFAYAENLSDEFDGEDVEISGNIPVAKYTEMGIPAYILPISFYKKL